jgi:hypothetical protein
LNGNKEISEKLYCWGTVVQVTLKGDLLRSKDWSVLSAWHTAAEDVFAQGRNILPVNIQIIVVSCEHVSTLCLPFGRRIIGY